VRSEPRVLCVDKLGNCQAFILAVALRRALSREKELSHVEVDWAGISEEDCKSIVSDLVLGSLTAVGLGIELHRIGGRFECYPLSTVPEPSSCNLIICSESYQVTQVRGKVGPDPVIILANAPEGICLPEKIPAEAYFACVNMIVKKVVPPIISQVKDILVPA